jgi:hypothetical protein
VAEQTNAAGTGRSGDRAFSVAALMLAAGDIAACPTAGSGAEATAQLLDSLPSDVIAPLGDLAYENGTSAEFANCYDPTWGRHKAGERPAVGNRDYNTPGASGYFTYFGPVAGQPGQGYYSYDVGTWHVVVLNSNCAEVTGGCGAASAQAAWLTQDLQAHPSTCALAYWHHPLFASTATTVNVGVAPLWQILDSQGVDVLLVGHAHIYERFAPQTSGGAADPNGVRQWIVGTGGRDHHAINANPANSEVRNNDTFGVLNLTLRATGYDWRFAPTAGGTLTNEAGSDTCR